MNSLAKRLNDQPASLSFLGLATCLMAFSTLAFSAEVPTVTVQSRQVGVSYALDGVIQAVKPDLNQVPGPLYECRWLRGLGGQCRSVSVSSPT